VARYTPRNVYMQLPGLAALCPTLRVVRPSIEHALLLQPQAVTLDREIDVEKKEATSATAAKGDVKTELDDLKQALDKATDSTQRQVTRSRSLRPRPPSVGTSIRRCVLFFPPPSGGHHKAEPEDDQGPRGRDFGVQIRKHEAA
jgi:uncharacterized protein (DUF3084 family)